VGKRHASVFAPSKFQFTYHTRRRQLDVHCQVQVDQTAVRPSLSSKYLGVTLDTALNRKHHIQNIIIKISKSISTLRSLAGSIWGASATELRRFYQEVVIPQMMYGCPVRSVAQERREGYTRQTTDSLKRL
jgi:hypothetical protein